MEKVHLKEIKRLLKLRLKAQETKNLKDEADLCNALGNEYFQAGDFEESLIKHKEELSLCKALRDKVAEGVANRKVGDVYVEMCNFELAIRHHRRHLDLADGSTVEVQRANTSLGKTYLDQAAMLPTAKERQIALKRSIGYLNSSIELTGELQEIGEVSEKEINGMRIRSFINLGLCHHQLSSHLGEKNKMAAACAQGKDYFQRAICLAEKSKAKEELYITNRALFDVSVQQGEHSAALRNAESALRLAESSGDKDRVFESLNLCCQVNLLLENVEAAKKCLKKMYRLKVLHDKEPVEQKLKTVLKLLQIRGELDLDIEVNRCFKLHEATADLFCKLDCYTPAINHYKKQEALLTKLSVCTPKHTSTVLFSIATTLMDVNEFDQAVEYFMKEMKNTDDKTEHSKTWTHVAGCYERKGEGYDKVMECYGNALKCAEDAPNLLMKLKTLDSIEATQRSFDKIAEADETRRLKCDLELDLGVMADEAEDSEETFQNSCPLDDSEELLRAELEISDEDDSDSGEVPRRRKRANFSRKNEKGETPLHRACIEGQVKRVQLLVEQGHPINPRDFSQWTPLHEACNYGHTEIVELLLTHGADVNAFGGQQSDAITPIHDAATNGHFEIVWLLLKHKADPALRDSRGRTALDTLIAYYHRVKDDMDPSTKSEYRELFAELKRVEVEGPRQLAKPRNPGDLEDTLAKLAAEDSYPDESESFPPSSGTLVASQSPLDVSLPVLSQKASRKRSSVPDSVNEYRDSIAGLGGAKSLSSLNQSQPRNGKRAAPRTSLMHDDDVGDDFLIIDDDDTDHAPFRQPIKRVRKMEVTKLQSSSSAGKKGWKKKSTKMTDFCPKSTPIAPAFDRVDLEPSLTPTRPATPPQPTPGNPLVGNSLRVKVKLKDTLFLVAVPGMDKKVSWLTERAATLYEKMLLLRPQLALFTADGARLLPDDLVADVISNNDVVVAREDTMNAQPFSQRYAEMCRNSGLRMIPMLFSACVECERSGILKISNMAFDVEALRPMLATINQSELSKIQLPGNRLGDDGLQLLCDALQQTMTSQPCDATLVEIDVTCNDITDVGLKKLARCGAIKNLTHLNLSYNPVRGGDGLRHLLATCTRLHSLNLCHCYVTDAILKDADFTSALRDGLHHLRSLDISENDLGSSGVSRWLDALDRDGVDALNLSAVAESSNNANLVCHVERFVRKGDGKLSLVDISGNHLRSKHVDALRPLLPFIKTLKVSDEY